MTTNPPEYNHEPSYHVQWYKLKYRKPVPCSDREANKLLSSNRKHVRSTYIGAIWVSTVFLCLDHGGNPARPLLFETMSLDKDFQCQDCLRATTWREALNNHWEIVNKVKHEHNTKR